MGIEGERAPVPGSRRRPVTQAGLEEAAMEELERVTRAEPKRALRVVERLTAAAVAGERPGEHVVSEDARAVGVAAAGKLERLWEANAVVDVEERDVEIVLDAVRGEQPLDHADQRVLLACLPLLAGRAVEVAQESDLLGQWHAGDRCPFVGDRPAQV